MFQISAKCSSMASAVPGPPDLISDHAVVQPVDLVNSVQRPAVVTMDNQMRVDIVDNLPASEDHEVSPDIPTDGLDARGWLGLGRSNGGTSGRRTFNEKILIIMDFICQVFRCQHIKMMRSTT